MSSGWNSVYSKGGFCFLNHCCGGIRMRLDASRKGRLLTDMLSTIATQWSPPWRCRHTPLLSRSASLSPPYISIPSFFQTCHVFIRPLPSTLPQKGWKKSLLSFHPPPGTHWGWSPTLEAGPSAEEDQGWGEKMSWEFPTMPRGRSAGCSGKQGGGQRKGEGLGGEGEELWLGASYLGKRGGRVEGDVAGSGLMGVAAPCMTPALMGGDAHRPVWQQQVGRCQGDQVYPGHVLLLAF